MASNINADPIDANYPIAGTNNSTQGFRDNFTNIKNNLNYAKSELSDLQSKAILKSALNGQALKNDFSETVISNVTLRSPGTVINDLGATAGTTVLDFSVSTHYLISTTDSVSISFTDWPTAGICGSIRLVIKINSIDHTLTIPGSVNMGLTNIAGLVSSSIYGLSIKPPTKIVSTTTTTTTTLAPISSTTTTTAPISTTTSATTTTAAPISTTTSATTTTAAPTTTTTATPSTFRYYTVDQSQTVGSASIPIQFTGTTLTGITAVFLGFITDTVLTVTSVVSGTIVSDMTLADSSALGSSTITFAVPGDYVFDFETIDHGNSILIMDQSRASNVENVSYAPFSLRPATATRLGGIKVGTSLNVTTDGTLSPKIASSSVAGVVKVGAGLSIAADGTLSTSGGSGVSNTLSNNSLVFSAFGLDIIDQPNFIVPGTGVWINAGVSLRIPADGAYRFRIAGALFFYISAGGNPAPGTLRIYVNGVNSSASDIIFPTPNLAIVGSGNTDVYQNITGLKRGDKIELYYSFGTVDATINTIAATLIQSALGFFGNKHTPVNRVTSYIGTAVFTVLVAGESNGGVHALSDYDYDNTRYPALSNPGTTIYYRAYTGGSSTGGGFTDGGGDASAGASASASASADNGASASASASASSDSASGASSDGADGY
jgi:hypothetical protein